MTQDAVSTPVAFTLLQDGRQAGVFKDWRLENGGSVLSQSLSVDVPAGATELTVNGQQLDLAAAGLSGGESATFVALPGDYVIAPPPGGKYVNFGGDQTVEVRADGSGDTDPVAFTASPTDAVRKDAISAANAKIDECAAKAEFAPDGCPFGSSITTTTRTTAIRYGPSTRTRPKRWKGAGTRCICAQMIPERSP